MAFRGKNGPGYCWIYFKNEITDKDWEKGLRVLEEFMFNQSGHGVICTIALNGATISPAQRKLLKEHGDRNQKTFENVKAHAFVTDSLIIKGTLTALSWVIRKPFPEKVFGSYHEAIEWLMTKETKRNLARMAIEIEGALEVL